MSENIPPQNETPLPYPSPANQTQQAGTTYLPVISLVLGFVGLFTGPLFALAAIIVGIIGRKKAKELGQGTGMAIAGIVLGVIAILLLVLFIVLNPGLIESFIDFASNTNK